MMHVPIIVKKAKRRKHRHHGGAWKVAYADFVTAMMAFFLLLWLLNAATREQLQGISDYFSPIATRPTTSGADGFLAGRALAEKGTFGSSPKQRTLGEERAAIEQALIPRPARRTQEDAEHASARDAREEGQLAEAEAALHAAVSGLPRAEVLAKSLIIDRTPEGLRIQIVDQEGLPMFPRGEATMYTHTRALLDMVAKVILEMPQSVAISGHTDALPFAPAASYSNWELSADRANAVRRALLESGVPASRIARVIGKAATEPLLRDDPDAPGNRRMTVVLLRGTNEGR